MKYAARIKCINTARIIFALILFPAIAALVVDHMIFKDASAIMHIYWLMQEEFRSLINCKPRIII